jgi:hypothetical protein
MKPEVHSKLKRLMLNRPLPSLNQNQRQLLLSKCLHRVHHHNKLGIACLCKTLLINESGTSYSYH